MHYIKRGVFLLALLLVLTEGTTLQTSVGSTVVAAPDTNSFPLSTVDINVSSPASITTVVPDVNSLITVNSSQSVTTAGAASNESHALSLAQTQQRLLFQFECDFVKDILAEKINDVVFQSQNYLSYLDILRSVAEHIQFRLTYRIFLRIVSFEVLKETIQIQKDAILAEQYAILVGIQQAQQTAAALQASDPGINITQLTVSPTANTVTQLLASLVTSPNNTQITSLANTYIQQVTTIKTKYQDILNKEAALQNTIANISPNTTEPHAYTAQDLEDLRDLLVIGALVDQVRLNLISDFVAIRDRLRGIVATYDIGTRLAELIADAYPNITNTITGFCPNVTDNFVDLLVYLDVELTIAGAVDTGKFAAIARLFAQAILGTNRLELLPLVIVDATHFQIRLILRRDYINAVKSHIADAERFADHVLDYVNAMEQVNTTLAKYANYAAAKLQQAQTALNNDKTSVQTTLSSIITTVMATRQTIDQERDIYIAEVIAFAQTIKPYLSGAIASIIQNATAQFAKKRQELIRDKIQLIAELQLSIMISKMHLDDAEYQLVQLYIDSQSSDPSTVQNAEQSKQEIETTYVRAVVLYVQAVSVANCMNQSLSDLQARDAKDSAQVQAAGQAVASGSDKSISSQSAAVLSDLLRYELMIGDFLKAQDDAIEDANATLKSDLAAGVVAVIAIVDNFQNALETIAQQSARHIAYIEQALASIFESTHVQANLTMSVSISKRAIAISTSGTNNTYTGSASDSTPGSTSMSPGSPVSTTGASSATTSSTTPKSGNAAVSVSVGLVVLFFVVIGQYLVLQ